MGIRTGKTGRDGSAARPFRDWMRAPLREGESSIKRYLSADARVDVFRGYIDKRARASIPASFSLSLYVCAVEVETADSR